MMDAELIGDMIYRLAIKDDYGQKIAAILSGALSSMFQWEIECFGVTDAMFADIRISDGPEDIADDIVETVMSIPDLSEPGKMLFFGCSVYACVAVEVRK